MLRLGTKGAIHASIQTAGDPLDDALEGQVLIGSLSDVASNEISGAARSHASDLYWWGIEDSGAGADLYCAHWGGEHIDTIAVTSASNTDWEDLASATIGGTNYLYIADTGNNAQGARTYTIYRVVEPTEASVLAGTATISIDTTTTVTFSGGTLTTPDIECIIVDPSSGDLYFVTKRISGGPEVFSITDAQMDSGGAQSATYEGVISGIPNDTTEGYTANAVGGDARHDGQEIAIKTYTDVMVCKRQGGTTFLQCLLGSGGNSYSSVTGYGGHGSSFGQEPKGETAFYKPDGLTLCCVSEIDGQGYPAYIYGLVRAEIAETEFQQGAGSYTGTTDTYIDQAAPTTNNNTAVTFDIDSGPNAREGFIHFGSIFAEAVGQIKSSMTIYGGYLELVVNDTGSGITVYEMLTAWQASAGTMTWNSNPFDGGSGGALVGTDTADYSESAIGDPVTGNHVAVGTYRLPISAALLEKWRSDNKGLGLLPRYPSGDSGLGAHTADSTTAGSRPKLVIQSTPDPSAPTTITVQQGADGYTGGEDTYFWDHATNGATSYWSATRVTADANPTDWRYIYMKFGGLDQLIPAGATVTGAELTLYLEAEGQGIDFHELLKAVTSGDSWDDIETAGNDLSKDNVDCSSTVALDFDNADGAVNQDHTAVGGANFIALVQQWVDDDTDNLGMIGYSQDASDGTGVSSMDSATQARKPRLKITYTTP